MQQKRFNHAEYMSLQLMEIESFRLCLSQQSIEKVSFNEAAMLWVSEGYADKFKAGYSAMKGKTPPASA